MLTKTQIKILQAFTANVTKNFSLTDVSKALKMQYRTVHRTVKPLVKSRFLSADNKIYSLNYKAHHQELAYVEYLRSRDLLSRKKNSALSLFVIKK